MGYIHIRNLYQYQEILLFRECYALEKIHGTSAHIKWSNSTLSFFSGGEKHERFVSLFDRDALARAMAALDAFEVVVYGEAYGGKQQGQSGRYGKELKFVAFDVSIDGMWLSVPRAANVVVGQLGLEFVDYRMVSTDLESLNAERDKPSTQAKRNGVVGDHPREGVVLRPPIELIRNNGERLIAKHKRDDERETATPRPVVDPARLAVLTKADDIAEEWVTPTRLSHVVSKMTGDVGIERTTEVISAMVKDVIREAGAEIVLSVEAKKAIASKAAKLFKASLVESLSLADGSSGT